MTVIEKSIFISELEELGSFDAFFTKTFGDAQLFILCDENTQEHCLPLLDNTFGGILAEAELIVVEAGENSKNLEVYEGVIETLLELNADRNAVLMNLGGGMISDLGGFVASSFKRGIRFMNVPTSLLGMVDASWGGKNGLNIDAFKNQIGFFKEASSSLICPVFLHSLPDEELLNGKIEMLKHGLIADPEHWRAIEKKDIPSLSLIERSAAIKMSFVENDFREEAMRKALNFGHSFGHAFEALFASKNQRIAHGQAVAAGMICEACLSLGEGLREEELEQIVNKLSTFHQKLDISISDFDLIVEALKQDKKRKAKHLNISLLQGIGKVKINCNLEPKQLEKALDYYIGLN